MNEPIISVSGLRGIVGETLTPEVAMRYVNAFAATLPVGRIVIARDGRATGRMLADAVRAGLCAAGRRVIDADVAATPTTGVLVRQLKCAGGIQISASHNPSEYNGIKLLGDDGRVISARAGQRVLDAYRENEMNWVPHEEVGSVEECADTVSGHCALVVGTVNVDLIRPAKLKVLLDSNHGAGSLVGRQLLESLGCQVTLVGETPDGMFAHGAEPIAENLQTIAERVRDLRCDVGFCQDPDADRLAVIDETGRFIGEEYTLALCLNHVLQYRKGPVVTNCSTSRMSEDLAAKYDAPFFRSPVGEANVTAGMQEHDAVFGGEGNGGPIDPRVGYIRDSFVGMAQILEAMAGRQMKVSELVAELPHYEIHKTKVSLAGDRIPAALDALEKHFADAQAGRLDGLRLDWPGAWLLIRGSNTEPIVRIIAEAKSLKETKRLCDESARVVGKLRK